MTGSLSLRLAAWLAAIGLLVSAAVDVLELMTEPHLPQESLSDSSLTWCDANKSLVASSAHSLGLLPESLADRRINLVASDDPKSTSDLSGSTAISMLRSLTQVAALIPPESMADIGYRTAELFEKLNILGPRAIAQTSLITDDWLSEYEGGWQDANPARACLAAHEAFGN